GIAQELAVPAVRPAELAVPAVLALERVDRRGVGLLGAVGTAGLVVAPGQDEVALAELAGDGQVAEELDRLAGEIGSALGVALLERAPGLLDPHEALVHPAHAVAVGPPGRGQLAAGRVGLAVVEQDVGVEEVGHALVPLVSGLVGDRDPPAGVLDRERRLPGGGVEAGERAVGGRAGRLVDLLGVLA